MDRVSSAGADLEHEGSRLRTLDVQGARKARSPDRDLHHGSICRLLQIAGLAGFDFVVIDLEHGALSFSDVPPLINAALASGVRPIVRVGKLEPLMIGKALDVGADAVLVPAIETAEEAARAVAAAKFAPLGVRGASQGSGRPLWRSHRGGILRRRKC
jgi:2-keto-3-deoxy-L-rhamnonate aldolase RhmA